MLSRFFNRKLRLNNSNTRNQQELQREEMPLPFTKVYVSGGIVGPVS